MALATQCPHCHTTFRVASDQLKLRGGIVRCGTCQRIFDGNAHLIDLDALAARKASEAAQAAAAPVDESAAEPADTAPAVEPVAAEPAPDPEPEAAADFNTQPVYTLDFDHTFDPFGILPKVEPSLAEPSDDVPAAEDASLPPADPGADQAVTAADAAPALPPEPVRMPEPEPAPEPSPAYAYAPAGRIEPSFDLPVDEALVAQPLRGHEPELDPVFDAEPSSEAAPEAVPEPIPEATPDPAHDTGQSALPGHLADAADAPPVALPLRASNDLDAPQPAAALALDAPRSARAKALDARARRTKLTPTRIEAPRLRVPATQETDEPEFVRRSRRKEQSGKTVRLLLAAGTAVLLLLLAAQLLVAFRNELALRYPAARPLLNGLCTLAGCHVGLPARAENLVIDEGELAPIGTDTYSLNTTLRNQGSLVQAWPSIELELTDANNKPLLRRVFGPADYLPAGVAPAAGFGAHSEQPVRLNFALADLKPSSYHTFVFYP